MRLDNRHRVAGISHLRKNDQLSAGLFGPPTKIADLDKIRLRLAKRTRNLSDCYFHISLLHTFSVPFVMSSEVETSLDFSSCLKSRDSSTSLDMTLMGGS